MYISSNINSPSYYLLAAIPIPTTMDPEICSLRLTLFGEVSQMLEHSFLAPTGAQDDRPSVPIEKEGIKRGHKERA